MRIAIVSDIHGNWTALLQVLPELAHLQVDAIIGAGDYLWTTAGDAKVVEWLQQVKSGYFVRGNGDCMVYYERHKGLAITDPYPIYDVVSRLPERLVIDLAGYRVMIQHEWWVGDTCAGTERLPERLLTPPYIRGVDVAGVDIAIFGDCHLPLHHATPDLLIVHPGSVGAPFDADPTQAKFALLELLPDEVRLQHHAVPFDIHAANQEILDGRAVETPHNYYRKMGEVRLMIASPNGEHWEPTPTPVCWRRGKGAVRTGER